jgi:hypothetical protein
VFQTGVAYNIVPTYTGGPVDSFAISGTLPAGITLNKTTGALSGTPTATVAVGTQTATAFSTSGNGTRALVRSVVLGPLGNLHYSPDTAVYAVGLPVTNSPSYTGRAPTAFSVTPALPAGLALNATTGVITGSPTAVTGIANYTVRATNTAGPDTTTRILRLTISAAETYSTWAQHKDLYINTTANGAAVPGNVTQFPLLVRLDSSNFNTGFAQSMAGGADLRFTKLGDVVRLKHEIEHWDSTAKRAIVWVLVDSIRGNERNQRIRMHWSKPGSPNASHGPSVFDTANGFVAVWHMSETISAVGQSLVDATANGTTAKLALQGTGAAPANNTTGPVGVGKTFGGLATNTNTNGAYFYVSDSSASALNLNTVNGPYTFTAWASPTVCQSGQRIAIISKYNNLNVAATRAFTLQTASSGDFWRLTVNPTSSEFSAATSGNEFVADETCTIDTWQHVAGTYHSVAAPVVGDATSAANVTISVNGGTPITGTTADQGTGTSIGNSSPVFIGRLNGTGNTNNRFMRGGLDELTVSRVKRSHDWTKLSYQNQRVGSNVVTDTLAPVVGIAVTSAQAAGLGLIAKPVGNGILFQIQGAGESGSLRIALLDMRGGTVWSHAATPGTSRVVWNGEANNGTPVASGIYMVRVSILDGKGGPVRTLERRIPYTR